MRTLDRTDKCLSTVGLTKIFGIGSQKCLAVDHVDFDMCTTEVVSIVGESGSGKTTFETTSVVHMSKST